MKTAISLPDELFYVIERYAVKHGLSLNELYIAAVKEFIEKKKKKRLTNITQKINKLCNNIDTSLNPQIKAASKRILLDSEW
jgi:hypothetical protein